ncbi:MAG: hypothetical protein P1P77_06355 [Spirochaetaceae bacterium]|nr:hypothetical protein [Spirochaetaceae bacterium]
MDKVVARKKLGENSYREDREYWLSKNPVERFSAIEMLRRQMNGYACPCFPTAA